MVDEKKVTNICTICDSEYSVNYIKENVSCLPLYCPFCSSVLSEDDVEVVDDYSGEDENEDEWEDEEE